MTFSSRMATLAFAAAVSSTTLAADPDWMKSVGEALGKSGSAMPGGIYRVGLPRSDLKVTLDGVEGTSAMDLYAGVGLFSLGLSRRFQKVTAVESGTSAALAGKSRSQWSRWKHSPPRSAASSTTRWSASGNFSKAHLG